MSTAKNILIVDDDAGIRDVLTQVFELEGYNVTEQSHGRDIYHVVQVAHPQLILLDVMLGDLDGREICRELKRDPFTQSIPVILISAGVNIETIAGSNCLADSIFSKPFDIEELIDQVSLLTT